MQPTASEPMPPVRALRDDGTADPVHAATLSDELAVALYEHMVLARELDERLVALQREGRVTQHTSAAGEEAAVVGAAAAMLDSDWLFVGQREGAAALWRGIPLLAFAHRAFGSAQDIGKGRDAPGPPFSRSARVASASPVLGTQIPHAVGVAWAARLRHEDVATLVFFGDGATSSSDFHTGLNFAGVTKAPVVALCRNNGWAITTPVSRQTASAGVASKAVAYGLHGVCVDGTDVIAVLTVVREARARASSGRGGTLVEALTTQLPPGAPTEAVEGDKPRSGRDPIVRMRRYLELRALWSDQREQRLGAEVRADVHRALAEAETADKPVGRKLFDDVYEQMPWHLREQREMLGTGTET
jgi:pyruvate dehydrogenase E1 component subunit alpha